MNKKCIFSIVGLCIITLGLISGVIKQNKIINTYENRLETNARTIGLLMTDKKLKNKTDFIDYYIELEKLNSALLLKFDSKDLDRLSGDEKNIIFLNIIYAYKMDLNQRIIGNFQLLDSDEELFDDIYNLNIVIRWYFKKNNIDIENLLNELDLDEKYLLD